jgi:hypothetical protein
MRTVKHWAALFCLLVAAAAWANEPNEANEPVVHTEVKRDQTKAPKHGSLEFLRDNRVFLRGQLDRLSLLTTLTDQGHAQLIDDRMLRLQELARAIAAARDTVDAEAAVTARRELLDSVTRLGELENQLVLMETLLTDQKTRLTVLENDFLGHQETALVILVRGLPEQGTPAGLVLTEDNRTLEVPLSAAALASLRQGGVAQIYHRFVEPRDHLFTLGFAGPGWADVPPVEVPVTADRDRITFVELDLSRLAPDPVDLGLMARVWVR